jgi:HAE1 family hydrophobic/amphiphilic exporter-1
MNISQPFIERPIATTLLMVGILGAGIIGYRQLPVSDLPTVDYPTITVTVGLPGASPETMASAVATPLEKQFSTIAGVDAITSTSLQGTTTITLQFSLDRSIDGAAQDVQSAIAKTRRLLPQGVQSPSYSKANPADQPILYLALTSKTVDLGKSQLSFLPLSTVDEFGETFLAQRISTVPGVAQVSILGQQKFAVRIQLDPRALAYRRIGIDDVANAVGHNNVNLPTGILWGPHHALSLQASGQLSNAAGFRNMIVAYRNGAPVHLEELGKVLDDVQDSRSASWYNGVQCITLAVQRQPGTNTVEVAQAVREMVERLKTQLPPSIDVHYLYDRSVSIQDSVADVKFTLMLTLALVVLVIFLFLRNVSATVIPTMALPMSIVGTFGAMALLGYSLDNLSLMALTLAVGFVVDDAIVMLENIVRHLEAGKPRLQAALEGSAEVSFTIVSMTLSLAAVFIPVLFMSGLLGRLFREFAVTIGVSILVSGFVSLTLSPMMCSRFLKHVHESTEHWKLFRISEGIYEWSLRVYDRTLGWVMRHRAATMAFSAAILLASVYLFVIVPKGFIPNDDTGAIVGTIETAEGTSFDAMVNHLLSVDSLIRTRKDVDAVAISTGAGAVGTTTNQGTLSVYLKDRSKRKLDADAIVRELEPQLDRLPGIRAYLQNPPAIQIGGNVSKSLYQFTLQSPDVERLYESATALQARLQAVPELIDVTSDLQIKNPEVRVSIHRDRAAALGVTPDQIENALYDAFGSRQVSTIYTPNNQYWVIMELLPQYQLNVGALDMLYISSTSGSLVPMGAVADLSSAVGPVTVNHAGQLPSVTLSFNLREGAALGTAVAEVERAAQEILPASITTNFAGTAEAFQQSQGGLLFLLIIAVLVIYLVLGILYESFIHPITILSALPFATFGALVSLLLFHTDLNIYAYVGIIMLVGLVKKNGIMMIDFALDAQRVEKKSPADAIVEACLIRFRPIMMTTMCALMGTLPIAMGTGAGAEARRPLGIAVVGGLAVSQLITLYVTPVLYTYMDSFQQWLATRPARVGASASAEPDLRGST